MNEMTVVNPMQLLQTAAEKGLDAEQLEKLMNLEERWAARQSRTEFFKALSSFQADCPEIMRTKKAHNSKYAPLSEIVNTIRPVMHKHGLTHRWEIEQGEVAATYTCIITHAAGHSERTSIVLPHDDSGGKNAIQGAGSSASYGYRYTLIGALGISTADEDDDGGRPRKTVEEVEKRWYDFNLVVQEHWHSISAVKEALAAGNIEAAAEAMAEIGPRVTEENIGHNPRAILAKAATRGGVFTVEETKQMRSDDWKEATLLFDQQRAGG